MNCESVIYGRPRSQIPLPSGPLEGEDAACRTVCLHYCRDRNVTTGGITGLPICKKKKNSVELNRIDLVHITSTLILWFYLLLE